MGKEFRTITSFDSDFYNQDYFEKAGHYGWYDKTAFALEQPFHKKWAELIAHGLNIPQKATLLDIGCARGNAVYWWQQMGIYAFGVDISQWAIEHAHTNSCICLDITRGFNGFLFNYTRFDYAVCRETIEHIPEQKVSFVLSEIHKILNPEGIFLLSPATNRGGKEDKKRESWKVDPSHVTIKTPYWWTTKLERAGFQIDFRKTYKLSSEDMPLLNTWDLIVAVKNTENVEHTVK